MGIQSHEAIEALYNIKPKEDQGMKLVPVGKAEKTIVIAAGLPWPKITLSVKAVDENEDTPARVELLPSVRWYVMEAGRQKPLCMSRFGPEGFSQSKELVELAYGTHHVVAEISRLGLKTEFVLCIKHDIKPVVTLKGVQDNATGQVEAVIPFYGTSRPLTLTTLRQPSLDPEPNCGFIITGSPNIFFSAQFNQTYVRPSQKIISQTDANGQFSFLVINDGTDDAKLKVRTTTTELVFRLPVETLEDPPLGPISLASGDGEATEDIPSRFQGGNEISVPLDSTDPSFPLPEGGVSEDPFPSQELESLTLDESATGEFGTNNSFQAVGTPGFAKVVEEKREPRAEEKPEFSPMENQPSQRALYDPDKIAGIVEGALGEHLKQGLPLIEDTVEPEPDTPPENPKSDPDEYGATASVSFEKGEAINDPPWSEDNEKELVVHQVFDDDESLEITRPFRIDRPSPIVLLSAFGIVALIGSWFILAEELIPASGKPWYALSNMNDEPEGADDGDVYLRDDDRDGHKAVNDAEWLAELETSEPTASTAEPATAAESKLGIVIEDEPAESDDALASAEPAVEPVEPGSDEPAPEQTEQAERDTLPGCWRFTGVDLEQGGLKVRFCTDPDITTTCLGFYHRRGTQISPYDCFDEPELPPAECRTVLEQSARGNTWIEISECNDGIDRICADEIGSDGSFLYCTARSTERPKESKYCHDYQLALDADGVPYLIITGCPDGNTYRCLAAPDNLDSTGKFHGNCLEHTL